MAVLRTVNTSLTLGAGGHWAGPDGTSFPGLQSSRARSFISDGPRLRLTVEAEPGPARVPRRRRRPAAGSWQIWHRPSSQARASPPAARPVLAAGCAALKKCRLGEQRGARVATRSHADARRSCARHRPVMPPPTFHVCFIVLPSAIAGEVPHVGTAQLGARLEISGSTDNLTLNRGY